MKRWLILPVIISLVSGCAHIVPQDLRDRADTTVPVPVLFSDPGAYRGRLFILGGTIVKAENLSDTTTIEVVEKPLDNRGRPQDTDISRGRFLIQHHGYLDTVIFAPGRSVTVAGEVLGSRVQPLGEADYSYLLIESKGTYLVRPGYGIPILIGIGVSHSF